MSARGATFKYVVTVVVFCAGLVLGWGVIALQVFGTAACPARSAVTAATRLTIAAVVVVLVAYCIVAGAYMKRSLGRGWPLAAWSAAGFGVLGAGVWLEVVIKPAEFCF